MSQPPSSTAQRPALANPHMPPAAVQGQPFPGTQYSQQQTMAPRGLQLSQMQPLRPAVGPMQYRPVGAGMPATSNTVSPFLQSMRQQQAGYGQPGRPMGAQGAVASTQGTHIPRPVGRPPSLQSMARPAEQGPRKYKKRKQPEAPAAAAAPAPPRIKHQARERYPGSEIFTSALELDERVEKAVAEQRKVARTILRATEHVKKKVRIYVQSEHLNQPAPGTTASEGDPPSWQFTIWGKLVDGGEALQPPGASKHQPRPFTFYVRSLRARLEEGGVQREEVVWERGNHKGEHRDRFQIRRCGGVDTKVSFTLELDSQPQLCTLSPQLAGFMGCRQHVKGSVLQSLMAHIRMQNLQEPSGRVRCDPLMRTLFNVDILDMSELSTLVEPHLSVPPPYSFEYTIRPGSGGKGPLDCYDMDLYVAINPNDQQTFPALDSIQADPKIENLQMQINNLVAAASERARRRDMLLAFANDPTGYINGVIASQGREVRERGKGSNNLESLRRTQVFQGRWVEDAALRYLHRKMAAGT